MAREDELLTPDRWMPRGEAECRGAHAPIAVWQGIPGERAWVHFYHRGRNRILARWRKAAQDPSPRRVRPPCDRYSPCGGCPLMHLDALGQEQARLSLLRDALDEVGLAGLTPRRLVACPDGQRGYRHVVKLAAGYSDRGRIRLGAFGRNSRDIIAVPGCLAATSQLRLAMSSLAHHVIDLDVWPFEPEQGRGLLRYAVLRQSRTSGDILLTLVARKRTRILENLADAVSTGRAAMAGVHLHINDGPGNAIFQFDSTSVSGSSRLCGCHEIEERIAGLRLRIGPGDFFQTNPSVAERIYQDVADLLDPQHPVLDLYCGVGGMALVGARRTGWALGVEQLESAVLRARASAARNRVGAEFLCAPVAEALPDLRSRMDGRQPTVVVNPARRGLEPEVLQGLCSLEPVRLIYVSCNPRTLARDLRQLAGRGLRPVSMKAYDMFPNTSHCEVVTVLDAVDRPAKPGKRPPRRRRVRG